MRKHRRLEIEDLDSLQAALQSGSMAPGTVVQAVDLRSLEDYGTVRLDGVLFAGCRFASLAQERVLREAGALIFPRLEGLPYDPFRKDLYSPSELMQGYEHGGYSGALDFAIYAHAHRERSHPGGISLYEALAQRIHDHAIDDALMEFLEENRGRGAVGIMGGHGTRRSDPSFHKAARIAWALGRKGYLVVTGGGPGVMEAANLGAFFAPCEAAALDRAIERMQAADTFSGGHPEGSPAYLQSIRDYIASARDVVQHATHEPGTSLAVPTWFYGHEPTNPFASAVAKYFDNSIREEGLLAIAAAGVIYAPGSAGTTQEIFQDLTQNHYATYGTRSPMVFLGSERYRAEHALIREFARARGMGEIYGDMLALLDDPDEAVAFIELHPPRKAPSSLPLYELLNRDGGSR
ncbi:MAG: LOG family protein [Deltaproteobacteria bacterium]|nr:LOG family protein [Deltaproteobacteria bacterium]